MSRKRIKAYIIDMGLAGDGLSPKKKVRIKKRRNRKYPGIFTES